MNRILVERVSLTVAIFCLFLLPFPSLGHHSFAAFFDADNIVEVEGEITNLIWRNPHVRFSIRTHGGETWNIESNAVSILTRMDISPDILDVGDSIRVAGAMSRRGENELFVNNILLENGRELVTRPGVEPRWSTVALGEQDRWLAGGTAGNEEAGIFKVWSTHFTGPGRWLWEDGTYPLTPEAKAAQEAFSLLETNPIADCQPKGMPWVMDQPYPIEFIDQGNTIVLKMEEYDTVRTIHMDQEVPPSTAPATPLGYSLGQWDGTTLIVTTTKISWPYFNHTGIPQTEAVVIVERFSPSSDGSRLDYLLTVTDPSAFTEPVVLDKQWIWRPGEEVKPFNCADTDYND